MILNNNQQLETAPYTYCVEHVSGEGIQYKYCSRLCSNLFSYC